MVPTGIVKYQDRGYQIHQIMQGNGIGPSTTAKGITRIDLHDILKNTKNKSFKGGVDNSKNESIKKVGDSKA